jgi:hypothetical protein
MFALLGAMDLVRYSPRCYVVAASDRHANENPDAAACPARLHACAGCSTAVVFGRVCSGSAAKAHAFEAACAERRDVGDTRASIATGPPAYTVLTIPRSREVCVFSVLVAARVRLASR